MPEHVLDIMALRSVEKGLKQGLKPYAEQAGVGGG
ncbi:hypothetical protein T12_2560 [Trichinella patagoniensis]|uniref:Uncharacterized protein n=1 Tax=Trichinella patagoniensis TaxID=990121 RepID=A0A0V0Z1C4_9BILA|nr:hypothetical protein T12_2560 [Trichinella patagoniensis]